MRDRQLGHLDRDVKSASSVLCDGLSDDILEAKSPVEVVADIPYGAQPEVLMSCRRSRFHVPNRGLTGNVLWRK